MRLDHSGFKKAERQGIRVSTGAQITLDFVLELGATSETVTVTAAAPLLNTASADLGQVIDTSHLGGITGGGGSVTGNGAGTFSVAGGKEIESRVLTVNGEDLAALK